MLLGFYLYATQLTRPSPEVHRSVSSDAVCLSVSRNICLSVLITCTLSLLCLFDCLTVTLYVCSIFFFSSSFPICFLFFYSVFLSIYISSPLFSFLSIICVFSKCLSVFLPLILFLILVGGPYQICMVVTTSQF